MKRDPGNTQRSVTCYRIYCLIVSLVALSLAFWSKFYDGPYWRFADAYLGDVFIVICLYFWLALFRPGLHILTKFALIAALAFGVELFQATGLPAALNLPEPFVFILGTSYNAFDFLCYGSGLLCAVFFDQLYMKFTTGHFHFCRR